MSRKAVISGATNIILHGKSIIQKSALPRAASLRATLRALPAVHSVMKLIIAGAILRGDLRRSTPNNASTVVLSLGKYCVVAEGAVLRPPGKIYKGAFTFYPVRIGDCVHIGTEAIVEAASIGHGVEIGSRAIVVSALPHNPLPHNPSHNPSSRGGSCVECPRQADDPGQIRDPERLLSHSARRRAA